MKAKLLFSGFLLEHNLPLSTADHAAKLLRNMSLDSKIVSKHRCRHTNANWNSYAHMLTGTVVRQITGDLKERLWLTHWYELAIDGTSE